MLSGVNDQVVITSVLPQVDSLQSIFFIEAGKTVSMSNLSIHGAFGPKGSCISNSGFLTLDGVKLYDGGVLNLESTLENKGSGSVLFLNSNQID